METLLLATGVFEVMRAPELTKDFAATRLGVIISRKDGEPHEAWGILNPLAFR